MLLSVCFDGERKTKREMGGLYPSFPPLLTYNIIRLSSVLPPFNFPG
jgi:hypothetical protein